MASATKALKAVSLPGNEGVILQDSSLQGVTSATASLLEYIKSNFGNGELNVLEAGSGSGILSIMLQLARPTWQLMGIEIQTRLHDLAVMNAAAFNANVSFMCADLCSYDAGAVFELIISNPPWQKASSGIVSPNIERAICRTELMCNMSSVLAFCERNLAPGKDAVLLYPSYRSRELHNEAEPYNLIVANELNINKSTSIFHLQKG